MYTLNKKNNYDLNTIESSKKGLLTIQNFCLLYDYMKNLYSLQFFLLLLAEVLDVILDSKHKDYKNKSDIGKIKVKLVHSHSDKLELLYLFAYPLNATIIDYPIIGLIVLCGNYISIQSADLEDKKSLYSSKTLYYICTINTLNYNINNNRMLSLHSLNRALIQFELLLLDLLKLKYGLRAIIGRYKNNIIFAKDRFLLNHNLASIIIFNKDNKCNIGNTKIKDVVLRQTLLMYLDSLSIASTSDNYVVNAKQTSILSNQSLYIKSKLIIQLFNKLYLGLKSKLAAVLGTKLLLFLKLVITQLSNHTHVSAAPGSPTSPPIQKPMILTLKIKVKKILSKSIFIK